MQEREAQPPVKLITVTVGSDGKETFELNLKALEELKKIDGQLGVFSMCGGVGLGKSYLLNHIMDFVGDRKDSGVSSSSIDFNLSPLIVVQSWQNCRAGKQARTRRQNQDAGRRRHPGRVDAGQPFLC